MKRVCVFCGSSSGGDPEYVLAAGELGRELARRRLGLVYGGGKVGLMNRIANAALEAGGEVIGVIPEMLVVKEVAHEGLSELRIVSSMSARKRLMAELSDGFIALPGGYGTLDELIEMMTWTQLEIHDKPCGLLNVRGYFDHLLAFFDRNVHDDFVQPDHREMLVVEEEPSTLLDALDAYRSPRRVDKARWILDREKAGDTHE